MLYRCRNCTHEEARGVLPTASCGMLLFVQMGLVIGMLIPGIRYLRTLARESLGTNASVAVDMGWWVLLVVPLSAVVVIAATIFGTLALNTLLELLEWVAYSFRRCPKCGRRCWAWGFTRGFGL